MNRYTQVSRPVITGLLAIISSLYWLSPAVNSAASIAVPPTKKPAKNTAVKPAVKTKTTRQTVTEFELGGLSTEISDQFLGRINYTKSLTNRSINLKGSCNLCKSYTFSSKNKVYTTQTNTYTLGFQYRVDSPGSYRFLMGDVNTKDKIPQNSRTTTSGFYILGGGIGRPLCKGIDGEIGLAKVHSYDQAIERQLTPFYSFKVKRDMASAIALDGQILIVRPFESDTLIDSSVNLSYKINSNFGMRLSYVSHNLQNSSSSRNGWDKSVRLSLVFRNVDNR